MRSGPRPNNNSRPNITRLLLEGDGTLLDCLGIIQYSSRREALHVMHNKSVRRRAMTPVPSTIDRARARRPALQPLELLHGLVDDAPDCFDQHEHDL
jgi:hypothetical protein